MGQADGHYEVVYDNVRVPKDNLLGPRGQGFKIAQHRLGPGRIFHCMRWLGQAQRAFDLMCDRANNRVAFGKTLGEHQQIQKFVFDSAAEIQASRLLTLHAAQKIDQGDEARVEIGLIKVYGASMLHNVIDRAIQVHGARGHRGHAARAHVPPRPLRAHLRRCRRGPCAEHGRSDPETLRQRRRLRLRHALGASTCKNKSSTSRPRTAR